MRYHKPDSFVEASRIASAAGRYRFLAGGTDVLVQMRAGISTPEDMIDLKGIPGVGDIARTPEGGWRIGVAVPGAVAPTVLLVPEAAAALIGTQGDGVALAALSAAAMGAARPISDRRGTAEFRKEIAGVLARRAATIALARARGEPA